MLYTLHGLGILPAYEYALANAFLVQWGREDEENKDTEIETLWDLTKWSNLFISIYLGGNQSLPHEVVRKEIDQSQGVAKPLSKCSSCGFMPAAKGNL